MSPEIEAKVLAVGEALRALVAALLREQWQFTATWEHAATEADAIIATDAPPAEIAYWAMNVSRSFGVGMGSFSDTYLGDDVERVRDDAQRKLWALAETCRAASKE